ncbi:MAG: hypothetical protein SFV55_19635 [Haliscomenobacter sp.]|uniref:hypothetical protein n=1 Tax=Haliscomenobacter sp. TaxID=2717303 RepID=UPI0029A87691|nr:hypothetical protein [Haliscomenobacter sp.]MDX2070649.1 hypothetical protein [Haliscomenobacter sp.]
MKYLPAENITFQSKLKEAELLQRLEDSIEPVRIFRFGPFKQSETKPYQGKIVGHSFNISRIIGYRNSFLPRISGSIENTFSGSLIRVKMRLHVVIIAFLCLWGGIMGVVGILFLSQAFGSTDFDPMTLIPLGMLVVFYVVVMLAFKYESKLSKADLQSLFEAEIIEE